MLAFTPAQKTTDSRLAIFAEFLNLLRRHCGTKQIDCLFAFNTHYLLCAQSVKREIEGGGTIAVSYF